MKNIEEVITECKEFKIKVYKKDIVKFLKFCFKNRVYWGHRSSDKRLFRSCWQWNHTYFICDGSGLGYTQNLDIFDSYDVEEVKYNDLLV